MPSFRAKKSPKSSAKKPKSVGNLPGKKLEARVQLLEQEIKFAQALAGHEPRIQAKVLKNLKKWLALRSKSSYPFTKADFLRLWKGLYYAMWMSDKPLVQEELAEDLGGLLHLFATPEVSLQFYEVFLQTMNREWYGIDQWRIDKFMMLIRRVTRQALVILKENSWRLDLVKQFRKAFKSHIFGQIRVSIGLSMHFLDLYLEEVAKVSEGSLKKATVTSLIRPFITILATNSEGRITGAIVRNIFDGLLQQSDLGRQHREKFDAWKSFGFPTASIDDLEMVEGESDAESEETEQEGGEEAPEEKIALDPRAGRVNVVLHEIKFNPKGIIKALEKAYYASNTKSKARKTLRKIMVKFEKYAQGIYPLGIHRVPVIKEEIAKMPNLEEKAIELEEFEKDLMNSTKLLKTLTKPERRRFMKSGLKIEEFVKQLQKTKPKINGTSSNLTNGITETPPPEATLTIKKRKKHPEKPTKSKVPRFTEEPLDEWEKPLEEGEYEYFVPSTKKRLQELKESAQTESTVVNPFALKAKKLAKKKKSKIEESPGESSAKKRVRIALEMNTSQDTEEYLRQVRSSPQIPYDSDKKPAKGLLKPNLIPGPINPYYKRKIHF
uniref:Nucleolar protein n=1 Tax=Phlebotomus papatasi TaxID=29031 RepID=A0A1B0EZT5_PHLPP